MHTSGQRNWDQGLSISTSQ